MSLRIGEKIGCLALKKEKRIKRGKSRDINPSHKIRKRLRKKERVIKKKRKRR